MTVAIPQEYAATVVATEQLSPKVKLLSLATDRPIPYIPGQYASLLFGNVRRPISFASLPGQDTIQFVIDFSPGGPASIFARDSRAGDTLRLLAPYGRFVLDTQTERPLLFVATGTGIAPIRTHLEQATRLRPDWPTTLIFGTYTEEHLLFRQEFERRATHDPAFSYLPVLSDAVDAWTGERGWVTHVLPKRMTDVSQYSTYVCGNPAMVKDAVALLAKLGVPKEHIHSEQFTPQA
jgi:NAD(P)H-flavin reductase